MKKEVIVNYDLMHWLMILPLVVWMAVALACEKKNEKPDLPKPVPGASNTFLWKPKGEHSGKLVILTPFSVSREPTGTLTVQGAGGTHTGSYSQNKDNGQRAHYRFPKPGSAYGSNIKVVLTRGKHKWEWVVPNGGQRFEKGFNP